MVDTPSYVTVTSVRRAHELGEDTWVLSMAPLDLPTPEGDVYFALRDENPNCLRLLPEQLDELPEEPIKLAVIKYEGDTACISVVPVLGRRYDDLRILVNWRQLLSSIT